jgi:ATP-dependent Clp protease ATP-binding subunit ClpA
MNDSVSIEHFLVAILNLKSRLPNIKDKAQPKSIRSCYSKFERRRVTSASAERNLQCTLNKYALNLNELARNRSGY